MNPEKKSTNEASNEVLFSLETQSNFTLLFTVTQSENVRVEALVVQKWVSASVFSDSTAIVVTSLHLVVDLSVKSFPGGLHPRFLRYEYV